MNNSTENNVAAEPIELHHLDEQELEAVQEIEDASSDNLYSEMLMREILASYENAFNAANDKYEIKYHCTLTTHKVPTKEGNKDVAYLRLEKAVRSKQAALDNKDLPDEIKLPEWRSMLVHTEAYPFKNLQERVDPKQRWKAYLFQSCFARLVAAGLEYAELLHRTRNMEKEKQEQKLKENKLDLVITDKMPTPLTPAEEQYKAEITKLRASENG